MWNECFTHWGEKNVSAFRACKAITTCRIEHVPGAIHSGRMRFCFEISQANLFAAYLRAFSFLRIFFLYSFPSIIIPLSYIFKNIPLANSHVAFGSLTHFLALFQLILPEDENILGSVILWKRINYYSVDNNNSEWIVRIVNNVEE